MARREPMHRNLKENVKQIYDNYDVNPEYERTISHFSKIIEKDFSIDGKKQKA